MKSHSSLRRLLAVVPAFVLTLAAIGAPVVASGAALPSCTDATNTSPTVYQLFAFGQTWFQGQCAALTLSTGSVDATAIVLGDAKPRIRASYMVHGTPGRGVVFGSTLPDAKSLPALVSGGAVQPAAAAADRIEIDASFSPPAAHAAAFQVQVSPYGACEDVSDAKLDCSVDSVKLTPPLADGSGGAWSGIVTIEIKSLLPDLAKKPPGNVSFSLRLRRHEAAVTTNDPNALFADVGSSQSFVIAVQRDLDANGYGLNPAFLNDSVNTGTTKSRFGLDFARSLNDQLRIAAAAGMRYTNKPDVNDAASTLLGTKPDPGSGFNATDSDAFQFQKFSQNVPDGVSDAVSNTAGDVRLFKLGGIPQTDAGFKLVLRDNGAAPPDSPPASRTTWSSSLGAITYRSTGDKNVPDATDTALTISTRASTDKANYSATLTDVVASRTVKIANLLGPPAATAIVGGVKVGFPGVEPSQIHAINIGGQVTYSNKRSGLSTMLRLADGGTNGPGGDLFAAETWKIVAPDQTLNGSGVRGSETDLALGWRRTDNEFHSQLGDAMPLRGTSGPWYAASKMWTFTKPLLVQTFAFGAMQSRWISDRGVEQFVSQASASYGINNVTLQLSGTHSMASLRLLSQQDYDGLVPLGTEKLALFPVDRAAAAVEYKTNHARMKLGYASVNETHCANQLPPDFPTPTPSSAKIVTLTCQIPRTHGLATLLVGGDISKRLSAYASYDQAAREGSSPLISARKEVLASLRYRIASCGKLSIDSINRAGYDGLKDTAGSEYYANLEFGIGHERKTRFRLGYSYVNTYDITLSPTQKHQFSLQVLDVLRSATQLQC